MSDLHIDDFYRDAAITLHRLYRVFPRRAPVFVEDVAGPVTTDEFGVPGERHMSCFSTMLWLAEEGYLRFEERIRMEAIDQAVLTGRCFNVLTAHVGGDESDVTVDAALPASVRESQRTRIHRLRVALESGSSTRVRDVMRDIIASMHA